MARFLIHGSIRLPSPQLFRDAIAFVALDDVSMIDAPSVHIAETTIYPIEGLQDRIPYCLVVEKAILVNASYVLAAEVRHSAKQPLSKGDFITTASFPWVEGDFGEKIIDVNEV